MQDFNELGIFTAVAEAMSLTRAADALEISKAAVSKTLARLESRLAVRLFERSTRRIRLTEAGQVFLRHTRRVLHEANEAELAIARLNAQPRGTLKVVMPVTLAQTSVAPNLARFLRRHPELRLEIQLGGGQIDPIARRVDLALQTAKPSVQGQVIQKRLLRAPMGLYASPHYLRSAPKLSTLDDLGHHACMTLAVERGQTTWTLTQGMNGKERSETVKVQGPLVIGDPVVHMQLCLDGAGVAVLPQWLAEEESRKGSLHHVLPDWAPAPIELYALYPARSSMTPKLRAFLDWMAEILPPHRPMGTTIHLDAIGTQQ